MRRVAPLKKTTWVRSRKLFPHQSLPFNWYKLIDYFLVNRYDDDNLCRWFSPSPVAKPGKEQYLILELDSESIIRTIEIRFVKRDSSNVQNLLGASFYFHFGNSVTTLLSKTSTSQETHTTGIIFHFNSLQWPKCSLPCKWIRIESAMCGLTLGRSSIDIEWVRF